MMLIKELEGFLKLFQHLHLQLFYHSLTIVLILQICFILLIIYFFIGNRQRFKKLFKIYLVVVCSFIILIFLDDKLFSKINIVTDEVVKKERAISKALVKFSPSISNAAVKISDEMGILEVNILVTLDDEDFIDIDGAIDLIIKNLDNIERENITIIDQNRNILSFVHILKNV